jgi:hypothetical protein
LNDLERVELAVRRTADRYRNSPDQGNFQLLMAFAQELLIESRAKREAEEERHDPAARMW